MNNCIKLLLNPRVSTAIISAVSAIICTVFAGCKLAMAEFGMKDVEITIFSESSSTNTINTL